MVKHKSRLEKEKEAALASNIFSRTNARTDSAVPASLDNVRISLTYEHRMHCIPPSCAAASSSFTAYCRDMSESAHRCRSESSPARFLLQSYAC